MKSVIFLIFLTSFSQQQCSTGCLKCNSSDQCSVCDVLNKYYMSGTACVLSKLTNCLLVSQSGNCVNCSIGNFLSADTNTCITVPVGNTITKCALYSASLSCVYCENGFFMSGSSCVAVTIVIQNCSVYAGNGICMNCAKGTILFYDSTKCVFLPQLPGCLKYTFNKCSKCDSGYLLNLNAFLENLKSNANPTIWPTYGYSNFSLAPARLSVCQAVLVDNCLVYIDFSVCKQCNPGYYLSNGDCLINPSVAIQNCAIYQSMTSCLSCSSGYYSTRMECVPVISINNCKTYQTQIVTTTTCILCDPQFYLSNNKCLIRININIPNCQLYSSTQDSCLTCNSGFTLSFQQTQCIPVDPNCATFTTPNNDDTNTNCLSCNNGYVLTVINSKNVCVIGNIANCLLYSTATNCVLCAPQFYTNAGKCVKHTTIQNCSTYHASNANQCTICLNGYSLLTYYQTCILIPSEQLIANCVLYNQDGTNCLRCQNGYYIGTPPTSCKVIPSTSLNCINFDDTNGCIACLVGYLINNTLKPYTCLKPFDYISKNCNSMVTMTGQSNWDNLNEVCYACNNNAIPYQPRLSDAICVLASDLIIIAGGSQNIDPNCVRFGFNYAQTSSLVCMECQPNYFLTSYDQNKEKSVSTSCILASNCPTSLGNNVIISDDLLGFINICYPVTTPDFCSRYARFQKTDNSFLDYTCIQTRGNLNYFTFLPLVDANSKKYYAFEAPGNTLQVTLTSNDYFNGYYITDQLSKLTVLNYRGISGKIWNTNLSQIWDKCEIVWTFGTLGSIYQTSNLFGTVTPIPTSSPFMSCLRCSLGFTEKYTTSSSGGNTILVPTCQPLTLCQSATIVYGGLPTFLNSIVSCFVCGTIAQSGTQTVPTVTMEFEASDANNSCGVFLNPLIDTLSNTKMFDCLPIPNGPFVTSSSGPNNANSFPNCALYGVLTAQKTTTNEAILSSTAKDFCLACQTGYFPTYINSIPNTSVGANSIPSYALSSCTQIKNCDLTITSKPFNSCGKCAILNQNLPNAVYYAFADFSFIACFVSNTPNCFILGTTDISIPFTLSSTGLNICTICMSGFILNQDGYCDQYSIPNSSSDATFSRSFYANKYISGQANTSNLSKYWARIHYSLSIFQSQYGVTNCLSNYVKSPPSLKSPTLCVLSFYLQSKTKVLNSSYFIKNCIQYSGSYSLPFVCIFCDVGFVINQSGNLCVSSISNCQVAQNTLSQSCYKCVTGFVNVKGVCQTATISFCDILANTQTTTGLELSCLVCASGYFLKNDGSCVPGFVSNCVIYEKNTAYLCNKCKDGFIALSTSVSSNYCFKYPLGLNCQLVLSSDVQPMGFVQGIISCNSCTYTVSPLKLATWALQNSALSSNACLPYNKINDCLTYVNGGPTAGSTGYLCSLCDVNFYLSADNTSCLNRVNLDTSCKTYSLNVDVCIECLTGNFLDSVTLVCMPFPVGISNCATYSEAKICSGCANGFYLKAGMCILSTQVKNCMIYSANYTCSVCNKNYYMENSASCLLATAQNCLTFSSSAACSTCEFGFSLVTVNSVSSCVKIVVQNCAELNKIDPLTCGFCNSGYYLDSTFTCVSVSSLIQNCVYYDSATTCSLCAKGYSLMPDQKSCDSNNHGYPDLNCIESFVTLNPVCAECQPGKTFVNQTCTSCELYSSGCQICDWTSPKTCLICQTGFSMNKNGNCTINPGTIVQNSASTNNTLNNSNTVPSNDVELRKSWILCLLMVLFYV